MERKRVTSLRISDYTAAQVEQLGKLMSASQSEIILIAIDRMYRQEIGGNPIKKDTETPTMNAAQRVDATPALHPYRDLLLEYEWDNQTEHLAWVATADVDELVSWARTVRQGEQA